MASSLARSKLTEDQSAGGLSGLSSEDVAARRALGQVNSAQLGTSRSYLHILRHNVFTLINSVLFALGFVFMLLGRPGDAAATGGMVLINVMVAVVQEARAKRSLDRIALLTRPRARAVRDGSEVEIDPAELVLDDLVVAGTGDQIVVDGQLAGDGEMEVDESLLTGESDPVRKLAGDQLYSGSFVVSGSGTYVAQKVGSESFAYQITEGARAFRQVKTPMQRDVDYVVRLLGFGVTLLGALLMLSRLVTPNTLVEDLQIAAVVLSLVPQGLFFMITLTYALGAVRMAGKGALIQQANAVESLSNVTVLALDKTGTLTSGAIRLQDVRALDMEESELRRLLGEFAASGSAANKTSSAIAAAYPAEPRPVNEEVAFSSEWKWSSIAFGDEPAGDVYVLGAPEVFQPYVDPAALLDNQIADWTAQGLRVLLFGRYAQRVSLRDEGGEPRLLPGLRPLALLSFSDELRHEARDTIRLLGEAGVRVKVISGDHPETVAALARQVGFPQDVKLVSGMELEGLSDEDLARLAEEGTIFGRIKPRQKEQLIRALRRRGYYTAMIGDGVNDVLSLKQSHLGIAMQSGSQAARAVADMVLLNDSFAAVPMAFREGQRIINGMHDVVRLLLTRTFYVAMLIIAAAIVGVGFPLTPKYATVQALLTVGIPTLAFAAWARPGPSSRGLLRAVNHFTLPASFTVAGVSLAVYLYYLQTTHDLGLARTALTTVTVLCGLLLIVFVEPPSEAWTGGETLSEDRRPALLAALMLAAFGAIMVTPALREAFELSPLSAYDALLIAVSVALWAVSLRFIWRKELLARFFRSPGHLDP